MFDRLESRTLFATAALDGTTLKVLGTDQSDSIAILLRDFGGVTTNSIPGSYYPNYQYVVQVNGQDLAHFVPRKVARINILGLGGNDRINISQLPTGLSYGTQLPSVPMYIEGGSGDDRIVGGMGNDTLKGGRGDDVIGDNFGRNYIDGNDGNDFISGGVTSDTLLGGAGNDTISSGGGNDLLDGGRGDDIVSAYDGTNPGGYLSGPASNDESPNSGDTIISEAGEDLVTHDRYDTLRYAAPRHTQFVLDAYSSSLVTSNGPIID